MIALADAGFALLGPIELDFRSFLIPTAATALLAAAGWFYRSVRGEDRLGAILSGTAHMIGFAAVAAPLSYIAATSDFPLRDATLEAWDRQLGIDWTQMLMPSSRCVPACNTFCLLPIRASRCRP